MKRFDFAFERALEYREGQADQERMKLEQLHATRGQLENDRAGIASQIQTLSRSPLAEGITSSEDLRLLSSFVGALRQQESTLRHQTTQCEAHIEHQSGRCVVADRDHKLLARLREKKLAEWEYESAREIEQTATDLWLAGYVRRSNSNSAGC